MTDAVSSVQSSAVTQQVSSTSTATPTAATSSGGGGGDTGKINSLADLKDKAPQVYNAMMVGIAQNICKDMEDGQRRLKEIMEENRRNSQS